MRNSTLFTGSGCVISLVTTSLLVTGCISPLGAPSSVSKRKSVQSEARFAAPPVDPCALPKASAAQSLISATSSSLRLRLILGAWETASGPLVLFTFADATNPENWGTLRNVGGSWQIASKRVGKASFAERDASGGLYVVEASSPQAISVLKSADSGSSWIQVDSQSAAPGSTVTPSSLFKDPAEALYSASREVDMAGAATYIVRKSPNGTAWSEVARGTSLNDLGHVAIDSTGIWFSVVPELLPVPVTPSSTSHWKVYRSADSGSTFTQVDDFQLAAGMNSRPDRVRFGAAGEIWVSGAGDRADGPHGVIRRSINGGTTWATAYVAQSLPYFTFFEAFSGGLLAFGSAASEPLAPYLDFSQSRVHVSYDNGQNWNQIDEASYVPPQPAAGYSLYSAPMAATQPSAGRIRVIGSSAAIQTGGSYADVKFVARDLVLPQPVIAAKLSDTCLYDDPSSQRVRESARLYEPQYPLWSDGAVKRRFIYLPPGSKIDTTDMDGWDFPVGTRLWKEFTRDGKRVETRMIVKTEKTRGFASWQMAAYAWRADQSEADLLLTGASDVLGTQHDIPIIQGAGGNQCLRCHQGSKDMALGFDALQLSKSWGDERVDLFKLASEGKLTQAPMGPIQIQGGPVTQAAFGYLHSNCATCHSPGGSAAGVGMNLRHNLDATSAMTENAYLTTVGTRVIARNPAGSRVIIRMNARPGGMPAIGSEMVDPQGIQALTDWINSL
jgi:hypothetical protein